MSKTIDSDLAAEIKKANYNSAQDPKSGQAFTQLEEIVEDVDESNFIPAYLSSTENEMTDLNNTELNTEFNSSRPAGG